MSETFDGYNGHERRAERPVYCYDAHVDIERRVNFVESEMKVIKSEFNGLAKEVNLMSSMMTTVQRNTNDTNAGMQKLAAELEGVKNMMSLIHKYESAGGFVEIAKKFGFVLDPVVKIATIGGMVWLAFQFFHKAATP